MAVRRLEEQKKRAQGRYKPILFVVAVSIKDAYNAKKVLEQEFKLKTFTIASKDEDQEKIDAEQHKEELKVAMTIGTEQDDVGYDAVVSVLMLREGWDVRSVSVVLLLRKFSSQVYGQQVIGRGLRRMFPRNMEEKERLVVVDHPKLDHGWLWELINAYVKEDVGLQQELDLDEGAPQLEEDQDQIAIPEPTEDEGSLQNVELPEPEWIEEKPLGQDWREYLQAVQYPREKVTVTHEERTGESELDLSGTGFVTTISYGQTGKHVPDEFIPPREEIPLNQRKTEICDQVFDLAVEVLFNNGLPMSGRAVIYRVILEHVSNKFLGDLTIGQCEKESQLLFLQDSLHYVRKTFDHRELLKQILENPPPV